MALRVDNYLDETDRDNKFERTKVMDLIDIAESNNTQLIESSFSFGFGLPLKRSLTNNLNFKLK